MYRTMKIRATFCPQRTDWHHVICNQPINYKLGHSIPAHQGPPSSWIILEKKRMLILRLNSWDLTKSQSCGPNTYDSMKFGPLSWISELLWFCVCVFEASPVALFHWVGWKVSDRTPWSPHSTNIYIWNKTTECIIRASKKYKKNSKSFFL